MAKKAKAKAPVAKKQSPKHQLSGVLKEMLGQKASQKLLKSLNPDLLATLEPGKAVPTLVEMLASKLIGLALDPGKSNQWAVELLYDRMEGKAVQGQQIKEDGRIIEDRLDAITIENLNTLATNYAKAQADEPRRDEAETEDEASRRTKSKLHMPDDGADNTKGYSSESNMEAGLEAESVKRPGFPSNDPFSVREELPVLD